MTLLPLAMGIHYAFSSTNITLSSAAICRLCLYMTIPPVVMAVFCAAVFHRWADVVSIFCLVIAFFTGIYLIPLVSTESGVLSFDSNVVVRLFVVATISVIGVVVGKYKTFNVFIIIFLFSVCLRAILIRHDGGADRSTVTNMQQVTRQDVFKGAKCEKHNNVYLLVYDSYENLTVQNALGIGDPELPKFLFDHGYTLYDAYSTGFHTLTSMSAVFSVNGVMGGSMRSTVAGDNLQHDFLRNNGYKTLYMLCGYTMPKGGERLPGDYYFPTPCCMVPQELVLYTCILRGILSQSPSVFNHYTREEWTGIKRELIMRMPTNGNFLYAHSGRPDHALRDRCDYRTNLDTIRNYTARLKSATSEMRGDVELVASKKDDAIVILASDHGAYLLAPEIIDKPDARHLLDRHGVFLAIRWPKDYIPCLELNCLQNVMLEVLIYLTGDKSLAKYESKGETDPMETPVKTPRGIVRQGIIQVGDHKGRSLFEAANELFSQE